MSASIACWSNGENCFSVTGARASGDQLAYLSNIDAQDKDKLPAPLKTLDLRSNFKSGIREGDEVPSPSNTDRIIQQTVGITSSPGGTPGVAHISSHHVPCSPRVDMY